MKDTEHDHRDMMKFWKWFEKKSADDRKAWSLSTTATVRQFAIYAYFEGRRAEREDVAEWMLFESYATGHGDSALDLAQELEWQAHERGTKGFPIGEGLRKLDEESEK